VSSIGRAARTLASAPIAGPASIGLLGLLASATSIVNGFVYDDRPIVEFNSRVHSLAKWWEAFGSAYWPPHWGNTNYRPLTILSFAVQWTLGDGSPMVFHAVSIALYVAVCLASFSLARLVLPPLAAWIVAALFAVHPVHVEAVANVVGQSELIVALCAVGAVAMYVRARTAIGGQALAPTSVAGIATLYAIACFAKETGFLLPGLLVVAEITVVAAGLEPTRRAVRARAREVRVLYAACAVVGFFYLTLRHNVLGSVGDLPSVVMSRLSQPQLMLTMLGVVPEWARLLLWPAQLSADYSPAQLSLIVAPSPAVIPGMVILFVVTLLAVAAWRMPRRVTVFGLLWFAITIFPVSNLLLRSGVLLAERTLFLPSVGVMLAIGPLWTWVGARITRLRLGRPAGLELSAAVALGLILALGAAKSASRSRVWRNNDTFFAQIVEDAPLSYRAHHVHGMWLFEKGRRAEGEKHVRVAMAIFPHDAGPYADLADHYRFAGLCAPARELYERAIALGRLADRARMGLVVCLLHDGSYADAAAHARLGVSSGGFQVEQFRRLLAIADSAVTATSRVRLSGAARPGGR
jgi:hypothetical protein